MTRPGYKAAICIQGCDGSQDIIFEGLDMEQVKLLQKLAAHTSNGGCVPGVMYAGSPEEAEAQVIEWEVEIPRQDWMTDEDYEDALEWDDRVVIRFE